MSKPFGSVGFIVFVITVKASDLVSQEVQEMRNVEPCPPSAETHRPSRPDWVTSGQFPEPSQTLLSGSQGDNATRPNNVVVIIRTLPPYSTANRPMSVPLPIGSQNRDAQMNSAPTPPTYDQIFAPRDANTPNTAAAGTSLDTSPNNDDDDDDDKNAVTSCIKGVIMLLVAIFIIVVRVLVHYNRAR